VRRVKVLHLITHFRLGGAQDNTFLTVEGLDRNRFEVHLAGAPGGAWEGRARDVADRLRPIPSMRRGIFPARNGMAFFEVANLLRKQRYDIVHTHSTNAGLLGRWAAKLVRVPIIVHTVHGFPFNDTTFPGPVRKVLLRLERFSARLCDRMVMVSQLNKEEAIEKSVSPADKMVVVHSGIDMAPFRKPVDVKAKKRELGIPRGRPVVGMVGRLSECNAPEVFVHAALEVVRDRSEVCFVVVGDGHLRAEIEDLAGGASQIKFLGYRSDVPEILPTFDIFAFPIRWGGLGRSLTEAMITGRPVVASAVNGVPEIVRNGETGLLVPPDDPEAVAKKVCYLLDNPDVAQGLGQNARELVVPEFSAERMVERVESLYEELLAEKGLVVEN
jgi:glycosyltransferase involved in cell wall biosynthesis